MSDIRILLLGGTSEAAAMAKILAAQGFDATYSYAGRVASPAAQPLPVRIGGFGGAEGLARYLRDNSITHLIDATHPFAAQISRNACQAAADAGVRLIALERAPWTATPEDDWRMVADYPEAAAALPAAGNVFLAIGKQNLTPFFRLPHHFLLRFAAPDPAVVVPAHSTLIIQRGPFGLEDDLALLREHKIDVVVAKNAGGEAARAKLLAARALGLPVIMIDRPALPAREVVARPQDILARL